MKVVVFTCEKYYWLLKPFSYLFNCFWSELQEVIIAGYEPLSFQLPDNFTFYSIAPTTYPVEEWSTGVIEFLEQFQDEHFIFSFEDYWLTRGVNHLAISSLDSYLSCHPNVWRVDLTGDRLYSGRSTDLAAWGHLDMIETTADVPYCLSTQMSVMSRAITLKLMKPHLTPWQFELQDQSKTLGSYRVLGTKQMPVRYTIGWGTGSNDEDGNPIPNTTGIPNQQLAFIQSQGWLEEYKD